jgi:hypothetical protein
MAAPRRRRAGASTTTMIRTTDARGAAADAPASGSGAVS